MHWVLHLISFFIISFNSDDKPISWVMVFLFYAWIICSSGRSVSLYKITDLREWGRAWTQRLFSEPGLWATACSTIRTRVCALLLLREPCTSPPRCFCFEEKQNMLSVICSDPNAFSPFGKWSYQVLCYCHQKHLWRLFSSQTEAGNLSSSELL